MQRFLLATFMLFSLFQLLAQADLPINAHCPSDQMQKELLQDSDYAKRSQLIEHLYRQALKKAKNGTAEDILTIPVVIHVMHYPGQIVGTEENISMDQIMTGIQHLNDAFANIGDFSGNGHGINAGDPRVSVNTEIQFCLASQDPDGNPTDGVNRVATSLTVFNKDEATGGSCNGKKGGDLKDLSRWDTDKYLNIWLVREICSNDGCEVAGYAFFPGAHGQCYDGAVIEARYFGSSSDNSKVAVHELGHYLNLYHTFEGGCTNSDCTSEGDRVCDTPPASGSNYNACDTPGNTCNTDANSGPFNSDMDDLIADYMAYSYQSCQNTFTDDQKTRMRASLEAVGAPRHQLLTSAGCNNTGANVVYFYDDGVLIQESAGTSGPEAGDCRLYVDYSIPVRLYAASGSAVTANIAAYDNGATGGVDYVLLDNSVTFNPGETAKNITLRIYNDNNPEPTFEGITLQITSNQASFNNVMDVKIQNDDNLPVPGRPVIYQTDFSTSGSWTMSSFGANNSGNVWVIGANGGNCSTGNSAYISNDNGTTAAYNNAAGRPIMFSPANAQGYSDLQLEFDYVAGGNPDNGGIIYREPSGSNNSFSTTENYNGVSCGSAQHVTYNLPSSLDDKVFDFGFEWNSAGNGATQPGFIIDNVKITAAATPIATVLNSSGTAYLGPNSTAVFYSASGELLAQINNLTNWDYGCTTVEIDYAGTGATQLSGGTAYYTSKNIKITPTNNKEDGTYDLKLFFTEAEISGWEEASGDTRDHLAIMKSPTSMASANNTNTDAFATTAAAWDSDHSYTATINTGFSGFAVGNLATPLPLDLVQFSAQAAGQEVSLTWQTLSEKEFSHFEIERSQDGRQFTKLETVLAKGKLTTTTSYRSLDNHPLDGINYYRLKMVDLDGTYHFSKVVSVEFIRSGITNIVPNPVGTSGFTVNYQSGQNAVISLEIVDMLGRTRFKTQEQVQKGTNPIKVPAAYLPQGMYYLLLKNGEVRHTHRFWKK